MEVYQNTVWPDAIQKVFILIFFTTIIIERLLPSNRFFFSMAHENKCQAKAASAACSIRKIEYSTNPPNLHSRIIHS